MNRFSKNESGFSLIEAIVTVMVFSFLMVVIASIFVRAVQIERRSVASQRVQENAILVLETIAREIRVSNIANQDSNCSAATITMIHPVYGPIIYTLDGSGNVLRQATFASIVNTSDVQFTNLKFCVMGSGANDDQPIRVAILASLHSLNSAYPASVNLETTVTSRDLTTELQNP